MSRKESEQEAGRAALEQEQERVRERAFFKEDHFHTQKEPVHSPGNSFECWVDYQLRLIGEEVSTALSNFRIEVQILSAQLHRMEELMVSTSRTLMSEIQAAETKMDGYVTIINANTSVLQDAIKRLASLADEPTTDEVNALKADLAAHLDNVTAALTNQSLQSLAGKPAAPAPGQPVPAPQVPQTPPQAPVDPAKDPGVSL